MAFTVNFYSFSKKENSTARPGGASASYSCVMKEPCGILNPTIVLSIGNSNPRSYNYAFIPTFDRYYFVREWTYDKGFWYAVMQVDPLASWKDTIGASTCYVLRSAIEYNVNIKDTMYPGNNVTTFFEQRDTSPWLTDSIASGMFVVGIAGESTTYYLFYPEALDMFLEYLFSDMYIDDLVGGWATVFPQVKVQANPLQFITSILWMPFRAGGTSVSTIRVGFVDVPCVADRVTGSGIVAGVLAFPTQKHPQVLRGSYLNNNPFSAYTLFFPPWGTIPLDPDVVANSETIGAVWSVDLRTGRGTLTITGGAGSSHIMSWTHSQIGLNYQVSQVLNAGFGPGNLLSPAIRTATSPTPVTAGINAITGGVGAIGDAVSSSIPSATTIGSAGGLNSLRGVPTLQYEFKQVVDEDMSHNGRPLCSNRVINTLSGYILVKDADIAIPCTLEEHQTIKNYMEGGFYFE